MLKKILITLSVVLITVGAFAQDKSQLEKDRQEIQKELKEIQGMYNQVKGQKKQTLGQLTLLQRKISLQDQYVRNISKEVRMLDDSIFLSNVEISRLQKQLDTLTQQYARSVVYAYKNRSTYDYLNFIFSASSFNDALKRIAYLKSYRVYREQQVTNILETQKLIEQRKQENLGRKKQKSQSLEVRTKEIDVLQDQRKEKDVVVSQLKSKEKELARQIADKKKSDAKLKNAIAAIIRREIAEAKKEAARKAEIARKAAEEEAKRNPPKTTTGTVATPAKETEAAVEKPKSSSSPKSYFELNEKDIALNNSFEKNRGRLPWPVDNGYVSIHFGSYQIEGTLLKGDNPGVTINTPSAGVSVKSVFDGEVVGVYNMGDGMAVTIRHGKYFTTYSNLSSVNVSKGANVNTGQSIGR
ncbi:MAG TPA: peptidoglycan DD-metalloendopeptidase family protein, partial [Chitinophagaceae bacterium]